MKFVRAIVFVSAALVYFYPPIHAQVGDPRSIEIRLATDSDLEKQAQAQLERIVAQWDLAKWLFTRSVQIESDVTPHSHPVLTLNTNGLANDTIKTVSFVHEQLHWFLSRNRAATVSAITDLRRLYPDAPSGFPDGGNDQESTYLHLLIVMLEFDATHELFGEAFALRRLSKVPFYSWVYRMILDNPEPIRQIMIKNGLNSPNANQAQENFGNDMKNMMKRANARFAIKNWEEKPYIEGENMPKLTRASVTKTYTGDIEGEGQIEYLMMYRDDGSATFVGLERVVGRIRGKSGTFVLQRTGVFESGLAKESYFVIHGSATGELHGLNGHGTSAVGHGNEHPFTLEYDLP